MELDAMLEAVRRMRAELARFESELKREQALNAPGPYAPIQYTIGGEERWFTSTADGGRQTADDRPPTADGGPLPDLGEQCGREATTEAQP
jgi:hypothetical protein